MKKKTSRIRLCARGVFGTSQFPSLAVVGDRFPQSVKLKVLAISLLLSDPPTSGERVHMLLVCACAPKAKMLMEGGAGD